MKTIFARLTTAVAVACLSTAAFAAAPTADAGDPYPLATDAATGEPLGDKPITLDHDGRQLRFASEANADAFRGEPGRYLEKLNERIVQDQLPHYPIDTCAVSGEPLTTMGEPDNFVVGNRLVRLCCPGCRDSVEQDPAAVFAKLDAAVIEKQKGDYPLETCPIAGEALGTMGDPTDIVVAHRLVRLCCEGCIGDVRANPAKILEAVDAARRAKAGDAPAAATPSHDHSGGHHHTHPHGHGM